MEEQPPWPQLLVRGIPVLEPPLAPAVSPFSNLPHRCTTANGTAGVPPAICYDSRTCVCSCDEGYAGLEARVKADLLLDCQVADSPMLPRTFWLPCSDMDAPRCALEVIPPFSLVLCQL